MYSSPGALPSLLCRLRCERDKGGCSLASQSPSGRWLAEDTAGEATVLETLDGKISFVLMDSLPPAGVNLQALLPSSGISVQFRY